MIRILLAATLLPASVVFAAGPEQTQLDANQALFSVMAAINAAGYDADLGSPANDPFREVARKQLASKNIPCLPELKRFFQAHRQKDQTAELSQYVSFALSVDGPPDFKYRFNANEIPPDVVPLQGFETLMVRFYSEAGIAQLWRDAQPSFERMIEKYHGPASRALLEVNGYLRNPTGYLGRTFQVYVDLLAAPNQIQTRSYKDDYFVVVTSSPEPQADDIRHAYLHFLLDPLSIKYAKQLMEKRGLIDYAQGAPFLEEYYKSDFLLLSTECLIKAIESRLAPGSAEKKQALVTQALREGFVLTPHFAEVLPAYEKQEQSMRFYFPELVKSIDLKKEETRLANLEFATERPVRKAKVVTAERKIELTGPYRTLEEAEQRYASKELDPARETYLKVLRETDDKGLHARAYYGLARIAALQKDPELAEKLFQKTLEAAPDAGTKAWAHVYLGRLADASGDREQATRHYQEALKVEGSPDPARKAAENGLQKAFTRPDQRQPQATR